MRLRFENDAARCSGAGPVTLQLMRPTHSTNRRISPGNTVTVGVFTGTYKVLVLSPDGAVIEKTRVRVRPVSCTLDIGCPHFTPAQPGKSIKAKPIEFYNTTNECPRPRMITLAVNGKVVGLIRPGKHRKVPVPKEGAELDVLDGDKRLMFTCANPAVQPYEYYGCTDPQYPAKKTGGVVVSFRNSTETCGKNKGFPITLWVDGFPVKAFRPGTGANIHISKGPHRVKISKGLGDRALFDRSMDCERPFLFNYGCGKRK